MTTATTRTLFSIVLAAAAAGCAAPITSPRFDPADAGRLPRGYTVALTGGGPPPVWAVRPDPSAPGGGPVLVQESTDPTSYRFPLCVFDAAEPRDVTVSARFRAIAGETDQAAGLVLRYSPDNYYIARANALEDNVNLFKTVKGDRLKLDEVPAKVTSGQWHTLRFTAKGRHLTVALDGKVVVERDDDTFSSAGQVGLWTKADSVTAFADVEIEAAP